MRDKTGGLIPSDGGHAKKKRSLFGHKHLWVIVMFYVNCVALSAVPSVYNTALQNTLAYNWVGIFGHVAIIATHYSGVQVASEPCIVWCYSLGSHACQVLLWDTGTCTKLHLLRHIDLFTSQLASACISHIGPQALNQNDMRLWLLPPPIKTLLASCGSLAGSVLQGVSS